MYDPHKDENEYGRFQEDNPQYSFKNIVST